MKSSIASFKFNKVAAKAKKYALFQTLLALWKVNSRLSLGLTRLEQKICSKLKIGEDFLTVMSFTLLLLGRAIVEEASERSKSVSDSLPAKLGLLRSELRLIRQGAI